jgi:protein-arginine kinase activator protein McsA
VVVLDDAIEYVKVSKKVFEPISDMVKAGIYKDEQEALQHLVHAQSEQKIEHYGKKITEMEQKYGMDFSTFEKKIHSRIGEEDFEQLDDFIFLESYVKAYRYWEQFI